MRALVTGVAGFIGSQLADRLVREGWHVLGVDSFTPYYDVESKRSNVEALRLATPGTFEFVPLDLLRTSVRDILPATDVVFHLAGQPGVRMSWADGFRTCNELNVEATQQLLEASRDANLARFVFASSSSVYGNAACYPTSEGDPTRPTSPYGVTKLAAELLCAAYATNFGVPVTSLRYFTVYGPRQRPDMAIRRMIDAALSSATFPLYGDGSHVRDFTYVDDVVDANVRAATADVAPGTAINIAGGSSTTVADLLELVGEAVGAAVRVERLGQQPGDVLRTGGSIDLAHELLDWHPVVGLPDGVAAQVDWQRSLAVGPT